MRGFIKDRATFLTSSHNLVLDYELKLSIYDTVSSVVIETPENLPQTGDILYLECGFFGIVKTVSPDHGKTELGVNQINTIFARDLFYTDTTFTYLEDHLAQIIDDNFTNCPDEFYAIPYLDVTAQTHTAAQMRPDLEENVFNPKSYASKMRRLYQIFCEWEITRDTLSLNIVRRVKTVKNIDLSNPKFVLTEQSFSEETISKITSFCKENSQKQDWVLLDDGSIVNTAPQTGRVNGEWVTLQVENAEDVTDAVKDEFAKNEYSHKITFQAPSASAFQLYDPLQIKLDNKIFTSYVSGVTLTKGSNIVEVQCGELQTQYPYLELA